MTAIDERVTRGDLDEALRGYVAGRRWFRSKTRGVSRVTVDDVAVLRADGVDAAVAILAVELAGGTVERYVLPLALAQGDRANVIERDQAQLAVTRTAEGDLVYDALGEPTVLRAIFAAVAAGARLRTRRGEMRFSASEALDARASEGASLMSAEQSNTAIRFGERYFMKVVRKLDEAPSADLEVSRFLTERAHFPHCPALAGSIEYAADGAPAPSTVAMLYKFVPSRGDAWDFTLDELGRFFERALAYGDAPPRGSPDLARPLVGDYLPLVALLGQRTAELHRALGSDATDPAFAPEPLSPEQAAAMVGSARASLARTFVTLRTRDAAPALLKHEGEIALRLGRIEGRALGALRTRVHGDYHLGQVLFTGDDFVIIDFEGEPARSLTERKAKRSPLADVAGMLRSLHYASKGVLRLRPPQGDGARRAGAGALEAWAEAWYGWTSAAFLDAYLAAMRGSPLLPADAQELSALLGFHLLDKAIYELAYELNNRPDWVAIPAEGLLSHLQKEPS